MDDRCCDQSVPMKGSNVGGGSVRPVPHACASKQVHRVPNAVLAQIAINECWEDHDDAPGHAAAEPGGNGITLDREERSMNFADLDVRYLGPRARWHKSFCRDRDHFMALLRQDLPRPSPYAAANKDKARKADPNACYQARKTKRDPKGEKDRPRRAGRHLDGLSRALFLISNIHHDLPSDEVHDCKHH